MRYLFFTLIFISCQNQIKDNDKLALYSNSLTKSDSLKIEIDKSMTYRYTNHQLIDTNSSTLLLVSDLNNNGFSILDLENEKFVKNITFNVTGPNGIGTNSGGRSFYYHNSDSIFLFSGRQKKIFLANSNKEIFKSIDLVKIADFNIGEPVVSSRRQLFYNKEENIFSFVIYPIASSVENGLRNSTEDPVLVNLDINNLNVSKYNIEYGINSENIHYEFFLPLITHNNKELQLLFPLSNKIYNFKNQKQNYSVEIKSDFVEEYKPLVKGDYSIFDKFFIESSFNNLLLYNKYENLYYLIIELYIPFINPDTGKQNQYEQKPFSVLVFDDKFNKLTEQWFEGGKYLIQNCFVGPKGLYLSKNNPLNPDFDENFYSYDIYSLEKN